MSGLDDLLVVQGHDTTLDQLRHRRETLPERAALQQVETQRRQLLASRGDVAGQRDEVASRQASLEKDIATSEARIAEIDKRMYSGTISASRDLQAMATEIEHLKQRVSTLEDAALEAMDEREPLDGAVDALDEEAARLEAEAGALRVAIEAAEREIDEEIAREVDARAAAASSIADDLLARYEQLRGRLGGIGAAKLEHGTCMGCRMQLPATELDRLKREPEDALIFCEQCGRILVR
jgi:predicted  nucleic acid-binding Zn-ribbon protein